MARALIGRRPEMLLVESAVSGLKDDRGTVLAVTGLAGVGKSRLAREAVRLARDMGAVTLLGRAVPGGVTPYRPLVEALSAWARVAEPVDLGSHARAVDLLQGGRADEPLSPEFVAEAVLRLLPAVTGGGAALLLIEDLHWADAETLAAVEYLADAAENLPLLLVITARDDEGMAALRMMRALTARGAARRVELAPFDRVQTEQLASQQLGKPVSARLTTLLLERTGGLPLFVEELLAALSAADGLAFSPDGVDVTPGAAAVFPSTLADTVATRLAGLADEHRLVIEGAALLGRSFDHDLLAKAYDDVQPALQAATAVGLLHEDPDRAGRLRFRHALLRDGVLAATFPPLRQAQAGKLLGVLMEQEVYGPPLTGPRLATASELAVRAGDTRLATRLAVRRAVEAFDAWALSTAETYLSDARLHAGTDSDLVTEIDLQQLRVASLAGRLDVVERVGRALLTRAGDDEDVLVESHLRLAQALLDDGRVDEAEPHLVAAGPLVEASGDACNATRLELEWSTACLQRGDSATSRARASTAADLARPFADQADLVCAALLQEGRALLPDAQAARGRWEEGLRYADSHDLRLWRGRLLTELATLDDDPAHLAEAEDLAREAGAVELLQRIRLRQARIAVLRGEVEDAETLLAAAQASGHLIAASREAAAEVTEAIAVLKGESQGPSVLAALVVDDLATARKLAAIHPRALFAEALSAAPPFPPSPLLSALATRVWAESVDEARDQLLTAIPTLDKLGLVRPAEACRGLLRAAGVPLPRRLSAQEGVPNDLRAAGVTAREFDVLRLIAEGRTNREAAAVLYLSVRTVEKHVERLLLKTGAANRTALAGSLRSPGAADT